MNPKNYPDNCQGFVAVFYFIMTQHWNQPRYLFVSCQFFEHYGYISEIGSLVMNLENHPDNHPTLVVPTIDKYVGCKNTWPFK